MADPVTDPHFVVCVDATDCEDLQVRRIYRVLPDVEAEGHQMIRVVDDSGEDYVYPASRFMRIGLPESVEKALAESA